MKTLTESMFYVLMALYERDTFGTEIVEYIKTVSDNRVLMGPGTLYTILARFEDDKLIKEVALQGRKRTYQITALGREIFEGEIQELERLLANAKNARENYETNDH